MTEKKDVLEAEEAVALRSPDLKVDKAVEEGLSSMDDLIVRQREDMKYQKSTDRLPRQASSTFGRVEITDDRPGEAKQEAVGAQRGTEIEFSDGRKGVLQADGSIAVQDPKDGDHQSTRFYKNRESGESNKVDRTETVYDPGREDHLAVETEFGSAGGHGGRLRERRYDKRDDGLYQEADFDTKHTKDSLIGGYKGCTGSRSFRDNPDGLQEETSYDPKLSGGISAVRRYEDGRIERFDAEGNLIKKPEVPKPPTPAPKDDDDDKLED